MSQSIRSVDVAVVGGGAGGAYAAYRLGEHYNRIGAGQSVALFECSDRLGGRLLSKNLPGMPHVTAELGGMRFLPAGHKIVAGLIERLQLETIPFLTGNPDPAIGSSENYLYLRRRRLRMKDMANSDLLPYRVRSNERNMNPDQLNAWAINYAVPNASKLTLDEWFQVKAFGQEVYKFGIWNLCSRVLSNEAVRYMLDGSGYDAREANASAVSPSGGDFGATVVYESVKGGFQLLPIRLAESFREGGGKVWPNCRLTRIHSAPASGRVELSFVNTSTDEQHRTVDVSGTEHTVSAARVILAMPRRSLELIDWGFKESDPWLRRNLRSVLKQPAFKLLLAYEFPWWRSLGLVGGESITDLPIRQVYYFGTEGEQPGANPKNQNSLLMATYSDRNSIPFWKGLENSGVFQGYRPRYLDGDEGEPLVPATPFQPTDLMIQEATAQVTELHGLSEVPQPYSAAFHDWSQDPFGAAWHSWKPGFIYPAIIKRMRHPIADQPVHICGEAYSNQHGWVEGALQTTERMLEEHFGLTRPDWIPCDYDLGP